MKPKTLYVLISSIVFMLSCSALSAQHVVDSSKYVSIVQQIQRRNHISEGDVHINQSSTIDRLIEKYALANQRNQTLEGFRIRIYRDNSQNARSRSTQIIDKFKEQYPNVGVYLSYTNPYFMVAVGDFRTADDAIKFQNQLTTNHKSYTNTYIIKEKIYFPPINQDEQ